ncbi:MAG: universal stress protein [Solirubrobacterales bacterium]
MHDDLQTGVEAIDDLDGAAPPLFRHVMTAGDDEAAEADATALADTLAACRRRVAVREAAELIALGSAADAGSGRVSLGAAGGELLDGARCPVAVAPRGFAARARHGIGRIDVGIDGSREAAAALTLAGRLARAHGARVRLVAIAELDFDLGGTPRGVDPGELDRLARHLGQASDGLAGVEVATELREGLADQVLVGLSREADLLLLGTRAAFGDSDRVALGGVAARVLRTVASPTMIVPGP